MALTHTNRLKQQLLADLEQATELADRIAIYRILIDIIEGQRSARKKSAGKAVKPAKTPEKAGPPTLEELEAIVNGVK